MMMTTITTRSRNIGYGSTAHCEQRWNDSRTLSRLEVALPSEHARGGIATVERAHAESRNIYSGLTWRESLFVGGRRVKMDGYSVAEMMEMIREDGSLTVELTDEGGGAL